MSLPGETAETADAVAACLCIFSKCVYIYAYVYIYISFLTQKISEVCVLIYIYNSADCKELSVSCVLGLLTLGTMRSTMRPTFSMRLTTTKMRGFAGMSSRNGFGGGMSSMTRARMQHDHSLHFLIETGMGPSMRKR